MYLEAKDGPKFNNNASKSFVIFDTPHYAECKACGTADEVDKFGFCLSPECRVTRLVRALHTGAARKLKDGTLVWIVEK